jgi:hypothetical protein
MQSVSEQRFRKHFPAETNTHEIIEKQCFRCGPLRGVILKTSYQWSGESQPVKRRLGGWCEMDTSLGPS